MLQYEFINVVSKKVMLLCWFDCNGVFCKLFFFVMVMMGVRDGECGSYFEIVDVFVEYGVQGKVDVQVFYCCVVFNVLIFNVDDYLCNYGFFWFGRVGWFLLLVYDFNLVLVDIKVCVLMMNINFEEGICLFDLLEEVLGYFVLRLVEVCFVIKDVVIVMVIWCEIVKVVGVCFVEINWMVSVFEYDDFMCVLVF